LNAGLMSRPASCSPFEQEDRRRAARVVAVCSSDRWGGTEKWVLRACEEMHRRGRKVRLVVRNPLPFAEHRRVDLPIERLPLGNEADVATLVRLARRFRASADVVLLTRVRDYWLGGMAAKLAGVRAILRLGIVRRLRDRYIMDRLRYGVLPDAILVNARETRRTLLKTPWIAPEKVHTIYNGVDAPGRSGAEQRDRIRRSLGVPPEAVFIVGAGRLAPEKRWEWLVDAAAQLMRDGVSVFTILLGVGDERETLAERVSRHSLDTAFLLPGYRGDAEDIIGAADVVAHPSANEGIPNVVLEAMGREVPVVAANTGGVGEHFTDGENILLAERDDFHGFAARLAVAVRDENLRNRIGHNGFETVRNSFSWEGMTDALERLIDRIGGGEG